MAINSQGETLNNGVTVALPIVAVAYSWSMLTFTSTASHSGEKRTIICNGKSVTVTLGSQGGGKISLLPFIRDAVQSSGAMNAPLDCDVNDDFSANKMRGVLRVNVSEPNSSTVEASYKVFFVFGDYGVSAFPDDVYCDYLPTWGTMLGIDRGDNYDPNTLVPLTDDVFIKNWCCANEYFPNVQGDFTQTVRVVCFVGDEITLQRVNYHFRYDCRTDNVIMLRWLDKWGNINVRQFTPSGLSNGAVIGDTYQRPHDTAKKLTTATNEEYWHGRDEWAKMQATRALTLGDDAIPLTHYDWLSGLSSSPCVEAYYGGYWQRCNIGSFAVECDPRKARFNISMTLSLDSHDVQEF